MDMSPSSTRHGGHYDDKYLLFGSILQAVFVGEIVWVFLLCLNQPVNECNRVSDSLGKCQ